MCDKLVFDLAQEIEGSPNVFVRKDWINILDNQNQNYLSNQSVIDTSQLSNSNKYMSYREAYLELPLLITLATDGDTTGPGVTMNNNQQNLFQPNTAGSSADYAIGLKNWFGNVIHSFTLDYNGTTIIQQTPFINMWNSFKLMTSLSFSDILTQGSTIGFYPDDPQSFQYFETRTIQNIAGVASGPVTYAEGQGVCNNSNYKNLDTITGAFNQYSAGEGNEGFLQRQKNINFNFDGVVGSSVVANAISNRTYGNSLLSEQALNNIWKSFIIKRQNQAAGVAGIIQYHVIATVYLKHIHSFFNMTPLLKGVFLKMTMNLNNCTTAFTSAISFNQDNTGAAIAAATANVSNNRAKVVTSVQNAVGGVNPIMIASGSANNGGLGIPLQSVNTNTITNTAQIAANTSANLIISQNYRVNLSVGGVCLDQILASKTGIAQGFSKSIQLYIPSYTFNPVFEQAYLSSPVKQIKYTDVYQYQVINVPAGTLYNNLLTNGISNIKSVLLLPFFSTTSTSVPTYTDLVGNIISGTTGFLNGVPVYQSPFDPAGTGPTSPLVAINNFNIQVSGQNAIYNTERYTFEHFNNQLLGQNAVNGGLTDGLTSGLVDRIGFDMEYCYYYTNIERMLPVDLSVPKSIQITGQNQSSKAIDILCFVEYGCEISVDALTGARV